MTPMRILLSFLCLSLAAPLYAQPRAGTLRLVVRDATDLTIPAAAVTITAAGGEARTGASNESGEARFDGLVPGDYVAHIESPGFTPLDVKDLRVRAGSLTNRNIVLQIAGLAEEIEVLPSTEDLQLLGAFTEQLTDAQIAALPDNADELAQVLQQIVGDDAEIRVNGFAGGRLPPGVQIQEVRVRYDDASGSGNGGPRVEVRTRPGSGGWRNSFNMNMRDDALNARNAFSGERPSGQTRQYAWTVDGPLVRNRTGMSLTIDRAETEDQLAIRAARPDGIFSALVAQPSTRTGFDLEIDHALTNRQELRFDINYRRSNGVNQGLSEFDLPERAYTRLESDGEIRLRHRTTTRRQWVNDFRAQYQWQTSEALAASDAQTIRVLDAFSIGGAQISGGRRTREFQLENELEFTVKRAHQMAFGTEIKSLGYSVDEVRNTNGTFTFASLEMYQAGIPTTYTQRTINPNGGYSLYQFSWYLQDSYRINRSLMLSGSLRHDMQTHLSDWTNFAPRASVTWTLPGRKTTLRASAGIWQQYFEGGLYEQTIWANGLRQRDIIISDPGYPDPFLGGIPLAAQPPSIVRAHPGIVMPYTRRASLGVDRTLTGWARLRATYSQRIGRNQFRSRDLNAPIDGVRPDATLRNVTLLETTARSETRSLEVNVMLNHRPKRMTANIGYTLGEALNETDGALTLPANSFDLSQEWGPSRQDVRHRLSVSMNTDLKAGFRTNLFMRAQSGAPYNITTGLDVNRDGQLNERPIGVSRNRARGLPTTNLDLGLTWERSVGRRVRVNAQQGGGGGGGRSGGGGGGGGRNNRAGDGLVRFEIFARASNVLNLVNPQNFSGVITSPFFGRATSAAAARRLVIGTRFFF
jgi:carboxypeptidase family protein